MDDVKIRIAAEDKDAEYERQRLLDQYKF